MSHVAPSAISCHCVNDELRRCARETLNGLRVIMLSLLPVFANKVDRDVEQSASDWHIDKQPKEKPIGAVEV
jgi:hypothetical protein